MTTPDPRAARLADLRHRHTLAALDRRAVDELTDRLRRAGELIGRNVTTDRGPVFTVEAVTVHDGAQVHVRGVTVSPGSSGYTCSARLEDVDLAPVRQVYTFAPGRQSRRTVEETR